MSKGKTFKPTAFQRALLQNVATGDTPLRNASSHPAQELVKAGALEKVAGVFVITKAGEKLIAK